MSIAEKQALRPGAERAGGLWRPGSVLALLLGDFALLGIMIGAQGVLWAELLPRLKVGTGTFGTAQLLSPLIAVGLLLQGGHLSARLGKKAMGIAALLLLTGASLVLARSTNL